MDGCGLLLEVMSFLSRIIPMSLLSFFWDMATPFFSLFFLVMLLWHTIFSLFGATIIWFYFIFRDVLWERSPRHGAFINVEWMDGGANSQCRNVAKRMGHVHAYDQESMKSISLGLQNLTKLNRTSSSICVRFFHGMEHMALVGLAYHWVTCPF